MAGFLGLSQAEWEKTFDADMLVEFAILSILSPLGGGYTTTGVRTPLFHF